MWPSHFYLDVCPHCYNWFVFVLRREYTNTSERPGEASFCLIIKTAAFCEHFTDLSLPGLGLQLPTGCARLTGPDATPHHTPQPSYTLLLISPTRFCPVDSTAGPSLLTCIMQTGRVQTLRTSLQILAVIPCLPVLKWHVWHVFMTSRILNFDAVV